MLLNYIIYFLLLLLSVICLFAQPWFVYKCRVGGGGEAHQDVQSVVNLDSVNISSTLPSHVTNQLMRRGESWRGYPLMWVLTHASVILYYLHADYVKQYKHAEEESFETKGKFKIEVYCIDIYFLYRTLLLLGEEFIFPGRDLQSKVKGWALGNLNFSRGHARRVDL